MRKDVKKHAYEGHFAEEDYSIDSHRIESNANLGPATRSPVYLCVTRCFANASRLVACRASTSPKVIITVTILGTTAMGMFAHSQATMSASRFETDIPTANSKQRHLDDRSRS